MNKMTIVVDNGQVVMILEWDGVVIYDYVEDELTMLNRQHPIFFFGNNGTIVITRRSISIHAIPLLSS
eukprot:m.162836 g.162836  ORF g.162836 m.162836 type:complete len:68 (+) comp31278_c1_seq45:1846-2049(+)